jgi:transposase
MLRKRRFGRACAALEPVDGLRRTLATLGRRWLALDTEAREFEAQITALITAHAPRLLARHGVGAVTAAKLLVTAGSNPDRLRGDAALAAPCGASPVQASSRNTTRHRLRRINAAPNLQAPNLRRRPLCRSRAYGCHSLARPTKSLCS